MKNMAMISMPHLLALWVVLVAFFFGAFVLLLVRGRNAGRARQADPRKEAPKKDR